MEEYINLILPLPISVNMAYAGYPKRHKSNEYKKWIIEAKQSLDTQTQYTIKGDNWLFVEYEYLMPCYCKNGKKKVIDVANYEKVLSDFLCKEIKGLEDHKIKKILLHKTDSTEKKVIIKIKEI